MTTKRKPINRPARTRITAEAIAAFIAKDPVALGRALGLKPWEANPFDVAGALPSWATGGPWEESYAAAAELRAELEHASRGKSATGA